MRGRASRRVAVELPVTWLSRQYESEEITSPLPRVPIAHHVAWLIESLTNRTLPSAIRTLTPPGCRLLALANVASLG